MAADNLLFTLKLDLDTSAIKEVDKISKQIGGTWSEQDAAINKITNQFGEQLKSVRQIYTSIRPDLLKQQVALEEATSRALHEQEMSTLAIKAATGLDIAESRRKAEQGITDELQQQRDTLIKIRTAMDPKIIREQVALEKQITLAQQQYAKAKAEIAGRPGFGIGGGISRALGGLRGMTGSPGGGGGANLLGGIAAAIKGLGGGIGKTSALAGQAVGQVPGLGIAGKAVSGVGAGAGAAVGGIGKVVAGIGMAAGALGLVAAALAAVVQAANPVVVEQLGVILKDIAGVLGQTLTPVLQALLPIFRFFGDVLATLLPTGEEMNAVLGPLNDAMKELMDSMREVLAELGPILREGLIVSLQIMIEPLRLLAKLLTATAQAISFCIKAIKDFLAMLGIVITSVNATASSVGAAAQRAQIQSVQSYSEALQTAAFSVPGGEAGPGAATGLKVEIVGPLADVIQAISTAVNFIKDAATAAWAWLQPKLQLVGEFLGNIWDWFASNILVPAIEGISAAINWLATNVLNPAFELIGPLINTIGTVIGDVWNWLSGTAATIWNGLNTTINVIAGAIENVWNFFSNIGSTVFGAISTAITNIYTFLQGVLGGAATAGTAASTAFTTGGAGVGWNPFAALGVAAGTWLHGD